MKKIFIITIICFLNYTNIFSFQNYQTNLTIIDSLVKVSAGKLLSELKKDNIKEAALKLNKHSADELFYKHLFADKSIKFSISEAKENTLNIDIIKSNVYYEYYDNDNDTLCRVINVNISAYINEIDGTVKQLNISEQQYRDKIARADIAMIEADDFDFAKSEIPQDKPTFFEEITQPLIVITGALITVILLFTVRSG